MKNLLPTRLLLKTPVLVMACIITLTLMVGCNGLPSVTSPPSEDSTKQAVEEPAKKSVDEPSEPAVSEILPGTTDFTDTEQPSESGALLGSPAFDMFLKIDGVPGESTDDTHEEWIEVLSFSHGVSQPASGSISSGEARTAERCDHQDFSIVKTLDKSSPKLALFCSNSQHITEVILVLCRAEGDKSQYMEYKMTDVIISSVSVAGSAATEVLPIEEVTFNYVKIEWTYTEHDPVSGKAKGDVKAYWDVEMNKGG